MENFLGIESVHWVAHNELAFALRDRSPVTPGHTLVIHRRHIATWFDASHATSASYRGILA